MSKSSQPTGQALITIAVAWSADGVAQEFSICIAAGTTIGTLTSSVELASQVPASVLNATVGIGIWGKLRPQNYKLRHGDRLELYRPLTSDPKEQRRQRAR